VTIPKASAGYYAADLARLESPIVFLDFQQTARTPALADWLSSPRLSRDIDEFFHVTRVAERWLSQHVPWTGLYDAVLFVRRTTAARGL
jgi:hypothetical protein